MPVRPVSPEVARELLRSALPAEGIAFMASLSSGEISATEGFRTENGGGTWTGSLDTIPDWGSSASTAIGAWQDLKGTWGDVVAANPGITFNPQDQIRGNWWLAQRDYKIHTGGGDLLSTLRAGDLDQIATALLGTWPGGAASPDFQDTYRALFAAPSAPTPTITLAPGAPPLHVPLAGYAKDGTRESLPSGGVLTVDDATVCGAAIDADGQGVTVTEIGPGTTAIHFSITVGGVTLTADLTVIVMTLARVVFEPVPLTTALGKPG